MLVYVKLISLFHVTVFLIKFQSKYLFLVYSSILNIDSQNLDKLLREHNSEIVLEIGIQLTKV
jgi:hypothetical protein